MVCAFKDGTISMRDAKNKGEELWKVSLENSIPTRVSVNSRGEYIAIATEDFKAFMLDRAGRILWKQSIGGYPADIAISRDGLAVVVPTDTAGIYLIKNRDVMPRVDEHKLKDSLYSAAISPDGNLISIGSKSGKIYYMDMEGNIIWKSEVLSHIYGLALSEKGNYLAAGATNGMIYFFNSKGEILWKYPTGTNVWDIDITEGGDKITAGCGLVFGNIYLFKSIL